MAPEPTLGAARLATVGALAEWAEIAADSDDARLADRRGRLRERMLAVVPDCREPGDREAEPGADIDSVAAQVARAVAGIPAEEWVDSPPMPATSEGLAVA